MKVSSAIRASALDCILFQYQTSLTALPAVQKELKFQQVGRLTEKNEGIEEARLKFFSFFNRNIK